jgi:DNA-directed RNA polymerase specialized sigma24 family protein
MQQALTERELIIYQLVTKTELSYRELADILDMSQTGVMKAYQRASKKMTKPVDKLATKSTSNS